MPKHVRENIPRSIGNWSCSPLARDQSVSSWRFVEFSIEISLFIDWLACYLIELVIFEFFADIATGRRRTQARERIRTLRDSFCDSTIRITSVKFETDLEIYAEATNYV